MANYRTTRAKKDADSSSSVERGPDIPKAPASSVGVEAAAEGAPSSKRKTTDDPLESSEGQAVKKNRGLCSSSDSGDDLSPSSKPSTVPTDSPAPAKEGFLSAWAMLRGLDKEDDGSVTESDGASEHSKQLLPGTPTLYDAQPYDLPAQCQVYDESQQAVLLKPLYVGLPNLWNRVLIGWKDEYTGQGRMDFGTWDEYCPYMDLRKGLKAMSFVSFQRVVHLARCDPRKFAARITPRSTGGRCMTMSDSDACVVSLVPIRVTNSQLTEMNDARRKLISGIMHSQDMERFVSVVCMVFGHKSMYCNLKDDEFTFETRPGRKDGPSPFASPHKPSRAFATKSEAVQSPSALSSGSGITAGYVQTTLSGSDPVRVYDGRNIGLNWASDMGQIHTILPRFDGEILPGSFAVVAHTITTYRKTIGGAVVGETANLNVQWVLLLGSPDQPRPARIRVSSDHDGGSGPPGDDDGGDSGRASGKGKGPASARVNRVPA